MIELKDEPLWPYLHEIAINPAAEGIVLTGGLGLKLKKAFLENQGAICLFSELPDLRPTTDLDFLLRVQFWVTVDRALSFREALRELGYKMILHSWHLRKPYLNDETKTVKLDLQSRPPNAAEKVRVRRRQVGREMGTELAGLLTPEAFSVDDNPIKIDIVKRGLPASVLVPHPYTWINLKTSAAYDWILEIRGEVIAKFVKDLEGNPTEERVRLKHVFDVYAIVGMMTVEELDQAEGLAGNYADHPEAQRIRAAAIELYGTPDSQGCEVIKNHDGGRWRDHFAENYEAFWDALARALGIPPEDDSDLSAQT